MKSLVVDRAAVARMQPAVVPARSTTSAYAEAIARHYESVIERYSSTSGARTLGQS
jgi:hypothetical protein